MVSAPFGRVCKKKKKNARAARITTEIRIVIRSTVVPSSRMHPPSLSPFLAEARDFVAPRVSCPSSRPLRTSFYRVHPLLSPLFLSFFRTTLLRYVTSGVTLAPSVTLVAHSSMFEAWWKKSCVYDVVSSTESNFHLYDEYIWKSSYVCARSFLVTKELMTSIGIALSIGRHFRFNLKNYLD